jgi:hypothetical protein
MIITMTGMFVVCLTTLFQRLGLYSVEIMSSAGRHKLPSAYDLRWAYPASDEEDDGRYMSVEDW